MENIDIEYWCKEVKKKFNNKTKVMFYVMVPDGYNSWDLDDDYNLELEWNDYDRIVFFTESGHIAVLQIPPEDEGKPKLNKTDLKWRVCKGNIESWDEWYEEWSVEQPIINAAYKEYKLNNSIEKQMLQALQ